MRMTTNDILIKRVVDAEGRAQVAVPTQAWNKVEELWEVTARGKEPVTGHPYAFALETTRMWPEERGGDIYNRMPVARPYSSNESCSWTTCTRIAAPSPDGTSRISQRDRRNPEAKDDTESAT
jgi:hypothetical protein